MNPMRFGKIKVQADRSAAGSARGAAEAPLLPKEKEGTVASFSLGSGDSASGGQRSAAGLGKAQRAFTVESQAIPFFKSRDFF
jgi:hypothetical protein